MLFIVQIRSPIAGQQAYFCFTVLNRAPANVPVHGSVGPGTAVSRGGGGCQGMELPR